MAQIDTLTNVGAVVSTDLALILRGGANVLGTLGSMVGQNSSAVTITGGTINGTTIGATTPSSVAATTGTFSGTVAAGGLTVAGTAGAVATLTSSGETTAININNTHANGWGSNIAFQTGGTTAGYFGSIGSLLGNTDQDLSVYSTAGNGFRIYTNGNNERFRISAAGALTTTGAATFGGTTTALSNRATGAPITIDGTLSQVSSWVSGTIPLMTVSNSANTAGSRNFDMRVVSDSLQFHKAADNYASSTSLMTLDAGGSVLIGKNTPTDLHNTWNHLIIGEKGAIISENGAGGIDGIILADNAYIDADTGTYAYQTTAEASLIRQSGGVTLFSNAASGSAGAALTPVQTMAINADGKVDVGAVSNQTVAVLNVRFNGAAFEFGHGNNGAGYYGTAGAYGNNGQPYIGFSCYSQENLNLFTTTGAKGNIITGDLSGNLTFAQITTATAVNQAPVNRMTLDASGNLGLGVDPSAWGPTVVGLDVGSAGSFWGTKSGNTLVAMSDNSYFNGSAYTARNTGVGSKYYQNGGAHYWETAASASAGGVQSNTTLMTLAASGNLGVGVAPQASPQESRLDVLTATNAGVQVRAATTGTGNGTTEVTSIRTVNLGANDWAVNRTNGYSHVWGVGATPPSSSAMTLDASGNLLVGTTSPSAKLTVEQASANANGATIKNQTVDYQTLGLHNAATSGDNFLVSFTTDASSFRGSITYNRAGGLIAYNTTSDYRAKDISGPVTDSGVLIDSTPVYMGKMKGATQERPMFIAHEVPAYAHTGEKDAVDADGNPIYQQMDVSALVPVMWAEIQSLRARLEALEGAK